MQCISAVFNTKCQLLKVHINKRLHRRSHFDLALSCTVTAVQNRLSGIDCFFVTWDFFIYPEMYSYFKLCIDIRINISWIRKVPKFHAAHWSIFTLICMYFGIGVILIILKISFCLVICFVCFGFYLGFCYCFALLFFFKSFTLTPA